MLCFVQSINSSLPYSTHFVYLYYCSVLACQLQTTWHQIVTSKKQNRSLNLTVDVDPDLTTMPVSKYFDVSFLPVYFGLIWLFSPSPGINPVSLKQIVGCMDFGNYPCSVIKWDPSGHQA